MALLLDDKLVGEVAEYCPKQFMAYYDCLGKGDAQACVPEQRVLADCVTTTAPSFKKIVKNCSKQMKAYEDCIRTNPDFRTQCFDLLSDMRKCVVDTVDPDP